jgi:hypothetical protein
MVLYVILAEEKREKQSKCFVLAKMLELPNTNFLVPNNSIVWGYSFV